MTRARHRQAVAPLILTALLGAPAFADDTLQTLELIPIADAFVDQRAPDKNASTLHWNQVTIYQSSYLKFRLPYLGNKEIVSAELDIKPANASANVQRIHLVDDDQWQEQSITYNNRPLPGLQLGSYPSVPRHVRSVTALSDALSDAIDDEFLSLMIATEMTDGMYLYSRESGAGREPRLRLVLRDRALQQSMTPQADTYVDARYPDTSFADAPVLKIDAHPDERGYLRFDLADLARHDVRSAKLRLYVTNPSNDPQQIELLSDADIDFAGITYNQRPQTSGEQLAEIPGGQRNSWVEVDLTEAVKTQRGGALAVALHSTGSDGIDFNSMDSARAPRLEIEYVEAQPVSADMALGINIDKPAWWASEWPFTNLMKLSSSWMPQCFPYGSKRDPNCKRFEDPKASAYNTKERHLLDLDARGWPLSLPEKAMGLETGVHYTRLSAMVPTALNPQNPPGRYIVTHQGQGEIQYKAPAFKLAAESAPGRDVIELRGCEDIKKCKKFELIITATDSNHDGDYLRDISVFQDAGVCADDQTSYCANPGDFCASGASCQSFESVADSQRFDPRFLDNIERFDTLRFMGFQDTNGALLTELWEDRAHPDDQAYTRKNEDRGPVEVMTDLGNTLSANIWVNMPPKVDDDYIRQFAQLTKETLNDDLLVYVEYSNEPWNFGFRAGSWMEQQAIALWPDSDAPKYFKRLNWYGMRTAQVCDIWEDVWAEDAERVRCVLAPQTGSNWLMRHVLDCPIWRARNGGTACHEHNVDAVAIAPYFGGYLGGPKYAATIDAWSNDADGGLDRLFRELMVGGEVADSPAGGALAKAKIGITRAVGMARDRNLEVVSYEGGQHLVGVHSAKYNKNVERLFVAANRDPRMKAAYLRHLEDWSAAGAGLFNQWTSVGPYSRHGSWGMLEHRDQPTSPKQEALMQYLDYLPGAKPRQ